MRPLIYGDLVPWYRLVDPPEDHADEAACFIAAFERAVAPPVETLLELGSGAGHNALHMKRRFRCTLTDVAPAMLELSRRLNPDCEHVEGDMRTLRLGRSYDAVLVHDAVMYMTSAADLRAAAATAFAHTRPGGAAIFAPDCLRETFRDDAEHLQASDGGRALHGLMWSWDPDPSDDTYVVDYAFLLRDGTDVKAVHDRHVEGLFAEGTWRAILADAGFHVDTIDRPLSPTEHDRVFLCTRGG